MKINIEELKYVEEEYKKHFCKISEDEKYIRFSDENIADMYWHNYIYIKSKISIDELKDFVSIELKKRKIENHNFLRIEFDFSINDDFLDFPIVPDVTTYDYMYIQIRDDQSFKYNEKSEVKLAASKEILEDGIEVDVLANGPSMGMEWARKRILRKANVYQDNKNKLDFYVCYTPNEVAGKCEYLLHNDIVKIEDFDIYEKFQRKGHGSAMINHLLNKAKHDNASLVYLITDKDDTAKKMYEKCGFKKIGEKKELFFDLSKWPMGYIYSYLSDSLSYPKYIYQ